MIEKNEGGIAVDDRGSLSFVNGLNFKEVERMYKIDNVSKDVIRAFHGHMWETKWVYVPKGSIKLVVFDIMGEPVPIEFTLSEKKPCIVKIPLGYANGFRSLTDDTCVIFFSDRTVEQSKDDDIRYPYDMFGKELWEIDNR